MNATNIDDLAGMFSQKSGVQQSMGNFIMSAIIGFMAQKMMGQGLVVCYMVVAEVVVVIQEEYGQCYLDLAG
jgi:hypothetical protein